MTILFQFLKNLLTLSTAGSVGIQARAQHCDGYSVPFLGVHFSRILRYPGCKCAFGFSHTPQWIR